MRGRRWNCQRLQRADRRFLFCCRDNPGNGGGRSAWPVDPGRGCCDIHRASAPWRRPDLQIARLHSAHRIGAYSAGSFVGLVSGFLAPIYLRFLRAAQRSSRKSICLSRQKSPSAEQSSAHWQLSVPMCAGTVKDCFPPSFIRIGIRTKSSRYFCLKLMATAATFGSGAVGGVFTPTLFIGAALGMLYGRDFLYAFPVFQLDPACAASSGMGSFIAATTGAPLMSILMAFELTLDYTLAPLLMVNCVVAYYCSSIFEKQFIYGESLERKGAAFFNQQLAEAKIIDLIRRDPITLPTMRPLLRSRIPSCSTGISISTSSAKITASRRRLICMTSKSSSINRNSPGW